MKYSHYILDTTMHDFSLDIAEIMALYDITESEKSGLAFSDLKNHLPDNTCWVTCKVTQTGKMKVLVEVWFRNAFFVVESVTSEESMQFSGEMEQKALKRLVRLNAYRILQKATGKKASPWGILSGVKPTKIVHKLLDKTFSIHEIQHRLMSGYGVEKDKADLLTGTASNQRPFLPTTSANHNTAVSIYIGIPYCPTRCLYCSFPAYVLPAAEEVAAFLQTLEKDIDAAAKLINDYHLLVQSVYIGGGTPTSLPVDSLVGLLDLVHSRLVNTPNCEITVEAGRPDSINDAKISAMKNYAVTRVSVNPQTMNEKTLKHIGRMHTVHDIIDMFAKLRNYDIPIINTDMIVGLPGENEYDVSRTMEQIMNLRPDNLTVHTLAIKKGSRLKDKLFEHTQIDLPSENTVVAMLKTATDCAEQMGMKPYYLYRQKYMAGNLENIGYSLPGKECYYNIQVMEERQSIIGIGPAAATKAVNKTTWQLQKTYNAKDVYAYIKNVDRYLAQRSKLLSDCFTYKEE